MDKKLKIGVIFGGRSGEHAVSLMSARFVLSQLAPEKYEITQIGITREGDWFTGENALDPVLVTAALLAKRVQRCLIIQPSVATDMDAINVADGKQS